MYIVSMYVSLNHQIFQCHHLEQSLHPLHHHGLLPGRVFCVGQQQLGQLLLSDAAERVRALPGKLQA